MSGTVARISPAAPPYSAEESAVITAMMPPGFNSPGGRKGRQGSATPPGWTGHGKKQGWNGKSMPPGLSNH